MDSEPSYLAHLGEIATLKNAIGSGYHQDAHLNFNADAEIFTSMWAGYEGAERRQLVDQPEQLLHRSDADVLAVWNGESHALRVDDRLEVRKFLASRMAVFKSQLND